MSNASFDIFNVLPPRIRSAIAPFRKRKTTDLSRPFLPHTPVPPPTLIPYRTASLFREPIACHPLLIAVKRPCWPFPMPDLWFASWICSSCAFQCPSGEPFPSLPPLLADSFRAKEYQSPDWFQPSCHRSWGRFLQSALPALLIPPSLLPLPG